MTISEKLIKIAENEPKVYEAGYKAGNRAGVKAGYESGHQAGVEIGKAEGVEIGKAEGVEIGKAEGVEIGKAEGIEIGKKAEYDAFWDVCQENGTKTDYTNAFGLMWKDEIFKPKYDICPKFAGSMFMNSNIIDLKGSLERQGVVLDMSNCTTAAQMFSNAKTKYVPTLDLRKCTAMASFATGSTKIVSIEKLLVSESTPLGTNLQYVKDLESIVIEGVIAANVSFRDCSKLTVDSLNSILAALKDVSGTGTTYTCTIGSTNLNKLTSVEKAVATQKGWTLA